MDERAAIESIGKKVVTSTPYYGSYTGIISGILHVYTGPRLKVCIIECIEPPSCTPEIFQDGYVTRYAYKPGSINNFDLCNTQLYEWNGQGGMSLEETLKDIVSIALEAKVGREVTISRTEWEEAKREVLNDTYANKFCFFQGVSSDYFINAMVVYLAIQKRLTNAA